jgi:hypothetical protein
MPVAVVAVVVFTLMAVVRRVEVCALAATALIAIVVPDRRV